MDFCDPILRKFARKMFTLSFLAEISSLGSSAPSFACTSLLTTHLLTKQSCSAVTISSRAPDRVEAHLQWLLSTPSKITRLCHQTRELAAFFPPAFLNIPRFYASEESGCRGPCKRPLMRYSDPLSHDCSLFRLLRPC